MGGNNIRHFLHRRRKTKTELRTRMNARQWEYRAKCKRLLWDTFCVDHRRNSTWNFQGKIFPSYQDGTMELLLDATSRSAAAASAVVQRKRKPLTMLCCVVFTNPKMWSVQLYLKWLCEQESPFVHVVPANKTRSLWKTHNQDWP